MISDEVHDSEAALARRAGRPRRRLLQEQNWRLSWTQHQDGVDGRNVDALIEEVDGEQNLQLAAFELLNGSRSQAEL